MEGRRRKEEEGRRLEMGKGREERRGEEKEKREKRFEECLVLTGSHTLYSKFPRGQP